MKGIVILIANEQGQATEATVVLSDGQIGSVHHNTEHLLVEYYRLKIPIPYPHLEPHWDDVWEGVGEGDMITVSFPEEQVVTSHIIRFLIRQLTQGYVNTEFLIAHDGDHVNTLVKKFINEQG